MAWITLVVSSFSVRALGDEILFLAEGEGNFYSESLWKSLGDSPREGGRISPIGEFGIIYCRRRCEERRNSRSNGDGGGAKGNGNGVGFRSRGTREVLFNLLCKRVTGCLPVENSRDGITHSAVEIRGGPPFVICPDETTGPGN